MGFTQSRMTGQLGLETYDERRRLTPREIIEYAVRTHNVKRFTCMFSGGKDSYVTAILSCEAINEINKEQGSDIQFDLLHCYTGTGSFQNFDFVLATAQKHGWKLTVEYPRQNEDYPQDELLRVLKVWGFAGRKWHKVWLKALKYNSIRRYHRENPDAWLISGKAPTNSAKRKLSMETAIRSGKTIESLFAGLDDGLPSIKPMFFMTKADTWQIVKERNLQLVDSYTWMSHSLECLCPAYSTLDEFEQLKRWYPDLATDIEILNEQYGGWHWVTDKRGRKYLKDFGRWGVPPKTRALREDQEQLTQAMEDLACIECSALRLDVEENN